MTKYVYACTVSLSTYDPGFRLYKTDRGRSVCDDNRQHGTPVQPQPDAMGAARRDPRRGEIPVMRISRAQFQLSALE